MRKLWKGVMLGGAIGAGVRVAQDIRSDAPEEDLAARAGKAAAEAALVGGAIGWFLDRRDAKRLAALSASPSLAAVLAQAGELAEDVRLAADLAVRKVQAAAEFAGPVLYDAAETARDRVVHAAETAKPHVVAAADSARWRAHHASEVVKPHVVSAAEAARSRANLAADSARPRIAAATEAAKPHVTGAMEVAAARAALAAEAARPRVDQARASFSELAEAGRQRVSA